MDRELVDGRIKAEQVTPTVIAHYPGRVYELGAEQVIHFTRAKPNGPGLTIGTTNEEVLSMLIHRTKVLDEEFPCEENKIAVIKMQEALEAFQKRAAKARQ
jgi:hypothetical protein